MGEVHLPGEPAHVADVYALFDQFGAPTGVAVACEEGDPLPKVIVNGYGTLHYLHVNYVEIAEAA